MDLDTLIQAVADSLFVELEASGRHVHVTKEQSMALFGHLLTQKRPLSQPGQFLAQERVTLTGPRGQLRDVAVLGPERSEGQVEISLTDARVLGIDAPLRLSGDIQGTPGAELEGTRGRVRLLRGVIAAKRHIHLNPRAAERFGVRDGETVRLRALTARPVTFEDVTVRVSDKFAPYAHLDYDEANACGFQKGDLGRIVKCAGRC